MYIQWIGSFLIAIDVFILDALPIDYSCFRLGLLLWVPLTLHWYYWFSVMKGIRPVKNHRQLLSWTILFWNTWKRKTPGKLLTYKLPENDCPRRLCMLSYN